MPSSSALHLYFQEWHDLRLNQTCHWPLLKMKMKMKMRKPFVALSMNLHSRTNSEPATREFLWCPMYLGYPMIPLSWHTFRNENYLHDREKCIHLVGEPHFEGELVEWEMGKGVEHRTKNLDLPYCKTKSSSIGGQ